MKSILKFVAVVVAALGLVAAAFAAEVSPTGTWKWTVQGRQGGQGFDQTLKLTYQDGKLSGTMLGTQGGQFQIPDTEIADAYGTSRMPALPCPQTGSMPRAAATVPQTSIERTSSLRSIHTNSRLELTNRGSTTWDGSARRY